MSKDIITLTAMDIAQSVRQKRISATEVVTAHLSRIEATDDSLKSFLTVTADQALEEARLLDQKIADGQDPGPLAGVPVAVKDNICTNGIRTTAGSKILEQFIPPYDATVVARLRRAGAIIIGKTNLDEFGMGSSTENSAFFPTRNPWNLDFVPGGSSGGSAAAVAALQAPLALGSDTGGSIRQPAAFCGVVGVKPTYGRVSRYGLIDLAPSLDHIGPLARTVADAALMLKVIAGHDPNDPTSANEQVPDFDAAFEGKIKGLRVGIPEEYLQAVEPAVASLLQEAIKLLKEQGIQCDSMSLPHTRYVLPTYQVIMAAEASSSLGRYDGVRFGRRTTAPVSSAVDLIARSRGEGFGAEVKRRIILGAYFLSSEQKERYFRQAQRVRTLIIRDFQQAFEKFDLLLSPVTPTPAFPLGEKTGDAWSMYRSDLCTPALNLAGLPGLAVPCGFIDKLPVGLQLIGRPFDEATLFRVAAVYENAVDFSDRQPPLAVAADGQSEVIENGQ